jgi:predicted  nucleic acid-binding Zn-ribbon protein
MVKEFPDNKTEVINNLLQLSRLLREQFAYLEAGKNTRGFTEKQEATLKKLKVAMEAKSQELTDIQERIKKLQQEITDSRGNNAALQKIQSDLKKLEDPQKKGLKQYQDLEKNIQKLEALKVSTGEQAKKFLPVEEFLQKALSEENIRKIQGDLYRLAEDTKSDAQANKNNTIKTLIFSLANAVYSEESQMESFF